MPKGTILIAQKPMEGSDSGAQKNLDLATRKNRGNSQIDSD
jgi:hypothetical protein